MSQIVGYIFPSWCRHHMWRQSNIKFWCEVHVCVLPRNSDLLFNYIEMTLHRVIKNIKYKNKIFIGKRKFYIQLSIRLMKCIKLTIFA